MSSGFVDGETAKAMERLVRDHYGMTTKDLLGVMNTMKEHGESLRAGINETEGGQTMLVEFGGAEEWAG